MTSTFKEFEDEMVPKEGLGVGSDFLVGVLEKGSGGMGFAFLVGVEEASGWK